jgi:ectoine hydroxylase-related dioxygenase (phytanoyl-CoA dioxygenase family)
MTTNSPPDLAEVVRRDGAAVWRGFLPPAATAQLTRNATQLATSTYANHYPKSTRVWDLYRHGTPFLNILEDQRLHTMLDLLLGEHHLLSDYSLNVVHPHQPVDNWHIDYPYNEMPHLVTGAILGLQCVLALDQFAPHNGATQYVPGSHLLPCPPCDADHRTRSTFTAEPGDLLIMAAATWHRSGPNDATAPRTAALLSFVERWVRPMTGPPEPGAWGQTQPLRLLLGMERPPETINGVPIT